MNVYCVEELCYLFANNPFMINTEIMDKHLPEWLREQCGLPELADRLTLAMKKGIQAGEFVDLNRELPDTENALRPAIYHNMGYAYAGLFMFDIAAKYYKRAYEMSKDEESGVQYLSSLRSYLSEEEYIRFIAEHSEYHELSLELEKKITAAKGEFEASRENRMLSALKIYKEEGNVASYYEEIDKIIYRLKEDYLQLVEE